MVATGSLVTFTGHTRGLAQGIVLESVAKVCLAPRHSEQCAAVTSVNRGRQRDSADGT